MESSLLLKKLCPTVAITHRKAIGGISKIRKNEVWFLVAPVSLERKSVESIGGKSLRQRTVMVWRCSVWGVSWCSLPVEGILLMGIDSETWIGNKMVSYMSTQWTQLQPTGDQSTLCFEVQNHSWPVFHKKNPTTRQRENGAEVKRKVAFQLCVHQRAAERTKLFISFLLHFCTCRES